MTASCFQPGHRVKLCNLAKKPENNGREATVVEFDEAKQRYRVQFDGGSTVSVAPENLEIISSRYVGQNFTFSKGGVQQGAIEKLSESKPASNASAYYPAVNDFSHAGTLSQQRRSRSRSQNRSERYTTTESSIQSHSQVKIDSHIESKLPLNPSAQILGVHNPTDISALLWSQHGIESHFGSEPAPKVPMPPPPVIPPPPGCWEPLGTSTHTSFAAPVMPPSVMPVCHEPRGTCAHTSVAAPMVPPAVMPSSCELGTSVTQSLVSSPNGAGTWSPSTLGNAVAAQSFYQMPTPLQTGYLGTMGHAFVAQNSLPLRTASETGHLGTIGHASVAQSFYKSQIPSQTRFSSTLGHTFVAPSSFPSRTPVEAGFSSTIDHYAVVAQSLLSSPDALAMWLHELKSAHIDGKGKDQGKGQGKPPRGAGIIAFHSPLPSPEYSASMKVCLVEKARKWTCTKCRTNLYDTWMSCSACQEPRPSSMTRCVPGGSAGGVLGFPKGGKEPVDQGCILKNALREWDQETGIPRDTLKVIPHRHFDDVGVGARFLLAICTSTDYSGPSWKSPEAAALQCHNSHLLNAQRASYDTACQRCHGRIGFNSIYLSCSPCNYSVCSDCQDPDPIFVAHWMQVDHAKKRLKPFQCKLLDAAIAALPRGI